VDWKFVLTRNFKYIQ